MVFAPRRRDDLHADREPLDLPTGAQITGRPMQLIGCVINPVFGRAGISRPRMVMVSWPIFCAGRGVAGARITFTVSKSFITIRKYQSRTRCACRYQAAGISAPAIRRSTISGSKSCGRLRRFGK